MLHLGPTTPVDAQKRAAATTIKRPLGKPPVKGDRAAQTWLLAASESQTESTIQELHSLLVDPDREVRVAAAWALGHLHVKETGKKAYTYDEAPQLKKQTKPYYPEGAYYGKIEGVVGVELVIDELGRVAYAEVRESIGPLDGSAVDCVKQWQFTPGKLAGRTVPVLALAPVSFRISK
jgi:TonB family protein